MDIQTTRSMYAIREDHYALIRQIEENGGELTPELELYLQLTEEEFESKAVSYGFVCKGFDDTEAIIDREIERLETLKARAAKNKELFKSRLSEAMQQFGVEKITTPTLTLSFRKSEAVEITDDAAVPSEFKDEKVTISISKNRINKAIKGGAEVPGAEIVSRKNLQIK
jgi:hypothetical protein